MDGTNTFRVLSWYCGGTRRLCWLCLQINAKTELALRYNDQSVLENHHAFVCSSLLRKHDLFSGLTKEQTKEVGPWLGLGVGSEWAVSFANVVMLLAPSASFH